MTPCPTASVIVAVYNAQDTVTDCIESLLQLEYPSAQRELIVVDNGSRDATPRILGTYGHALTVLHEEARGPAAARNVGLHRATGDVVAFTDSDCVVDRDWLRHIVAPLRDPTIGIVGGNNLARRPCNRIAEFGEVIHDHRRAIQDISPPYAITMNWSSRRTVLGEVGGFNSSLLRCSDVDMAYRLVHSGYRLVYEPQAVVYHRNRSTVGTLMRQGYQHGYYAVPVRERHAAFLQTHGRRSLYRRALYPFRFANRVAATGRRHLVWACLFNLAKDIGHLHGTLTNTARRGLANRTGAGALQDRE